MNATAWVPIMVLALAAPVACQEKTPPAKGKLVEPDREVVITATQNSIDVTPTTAVVVVRTPLKFTVGALPPGASEVEVDFVSAPAEAGPDEGKPYVGPFPPKMGDPQNPQRGRYTLRGGQTWTTLPADELGYWKYQVIVRFKDGRPEISIDPGVIIKEGI